MTETVVKTVVLDEEQGSNEESVDCERRYSYKTREISSYKVFLRFVQYDEATNHCDSTRILSKECYTTWLCSRRKAPKKPMEAFRRALTAHCRGVDGRRPFPKEVEASLLTELRKKKRWACFEDCGDSGGLIGVQGFPSLGYHEKLREETVAPEPEKGTSSNYCASSKVLEYLQTVDPSDLYFPETESDAPHSTGSKRKLEQVSAQQQKIARTDTDCKANAETGFAQSAMKTPLQTPTGNLNTQIQMLSQIPGQFNSLNFFNLPNFLPSSSTMATGQMLFLALQAQREALLMGNGMNTLNYGYYHPSANVITAALLQQTQNQFQMAQPLMQHEPPETVAKQRNVNEMEIRQSNAALSLVQLANLATS